MSKDELRKDVKQLQEVVLNVANMHSELQKKFDEELAWIKTCFGEMSFKRIKLEERLRQLQEDHAVLKKQFMSEDEHLS